MPLDRRRPALTLLLLASLLVFAVAQEPEEAPDPLEARLSVAALEARIEAVDATDLDAEGKEQLKATLSDALVELVRAGELAALAEELAL